MRSPLLCCLRPGVCLRQKEDSFSLLSGLVLVTPGMTAVTEPFLHKEPLTQTICWPASRSAVSHLHIASQQNCCHPRASNSPSAASSPLSWSPRNPELSAAAVSIPPTTPAAPSHSSVLPSEVMQLSAPGGSCVN